MDSTRKNLLLIGLAMLVGACQTPGTSATPDVLPQVTPATSSGAVAVRQQCRTPSWFNQSQSFEGRAVSTVSQDHANTSARRDLVKQIELKLHGEDVFVEGESTEKGFTYAIHSTIVESLNIRVSGMTIAKRYSDQACGRWFALARLDVPKAVRMWMQDTELLARKAERLKEQAQRLQGQGELVGSLVALHQLMVAQEETAQLGRRIVSLDSAACPSAHECAGDIGNALTTQSEIETVLNAVRVRVAGGDDQNAKHGRPLAQPLKVTVALEFPNVRIPLPNVPVQFVVQRGDADLDRLPRTNGRGEASAKVHKVTPGESPVRVLARLRIDFDSRGVPAALQRKISTRLKQETASFMIHPPQEHGGSNPFDIKIHALAFQLAAGVNASMDKGAVIGEFVENRTRQRLSLSRRIEQAIARGLVNTQTLRVTSPEATDADDAPVTVSGVYELDAQRHLWVAATLVRRDDHVIESTAETSVPLVALTMDDRTELLRLAGHTNSPPIMQVPAPTQKFDAWVEAFWNLRNPRAGFTTELHPLRKTYHEGDNALFRFRTDRDCYLTVVSIGASGAWTVLLPNRWRSEPYQAVVRASDGWVMIPGEEDGFNFTVSSPVGTERVKAICTTRPIQLMQDMDFSQGLFQLSRESGALFRDLKLTEADVAPEDWSAVGAKFVTLKKGQRETRGAKRLKSRGLLEDNDE